MNDMTPPLAKPRRRKPTTPGGRKAFTLITPRDSVIFAALLEYRFLTLQQIGRIVPRDKTSKSMDGHLKKLRERLGELFHTEHLHRTRTQHYTGIYTLAPGGADHLNVGDEDFKRVDWLKKNKTASWKFIEHGIETAEFRILLAQAMKRHRSIHHISGHTLARSIRAVTKPEPSQSPFRLRQPITLDIFDKAQGRGVPQTQTVGTVPDTMFLLQLPDGGQRGFAVEIDRGTEPIAHRGFGDSSIERKLRVYHAAQKAKIKDARWGLDNFRVLFVTPHPKRSENIRALALKLGTDVAWTIERDALAAETILGATWRGLGGKFECLVPAAFLN